MTQIMFHRVMMKVIVILILIVLVTMVVHLQEEVLALPDCHIKMMLQAVLPPAMGSSLAAQDQPYLLVLKIYNFHQTHHLCLD